jgi:hypothetical protein
MPDGPLRGTAAAASPCSVVDATRARAAAAIAGRARVLIIAVLLLVGVVGARLRDNQASSAAVGETVTIPEGKIAFTFSNKRGYLITDFQGRVQRRISLQRGRGLIGGPSFNATGTRLWFLSGVFWI